MPDVETRSELADFLKEQCVLKSVLREDKPCPKFGPSGTCTDCMHGWEILARRVLKHVGAKRAAYEQEREKVKFITDKAESLEKTVGEVFSLFAKIGDGFAAMAQIVELARKYKDNGSEEEEK